MRMHGTLPAKSLLLFHIKPIFYHLQLMYCESIIKADRTCVKMLSAKTKESAVPLPASFDIRPHACAVIPRRSGCIFIYFVRFVNFKPDVV